jgi:hypothetical protein
LTILAFSLNVAMLASSELVSAGFEQEKMVAEAIKRRKIFFIIVINLEFY